MTVSAVNTGMSRPGKFSGTPCAAVSDARQATDSQVASATTSCRSCVSNELCLGSRLSTLVDERSTPVVDHAHTVRKREHLFHQGDKPEALYIIKSGSAKLYFISEDGNEQVVAFYMPGEVLGLDALGGGVHRTSAVALERTTLCVIPLHYLEQTAGYHHCLYKLLSMELVRDQAVLGLIIKKDAEAKMARFLLNMSQRFQARGYSASCFNLSMKRSEIGSHLGIAVETVSRILTRFQELGLLQVDRRYIQIRDFAALERLAECTATPHRNPQRQRTA